MIDILCPSRMRPAHAKDMAESAIELAESDIHVTIGIDEDDQFKEQYQCLANDRVTVVVCGDGSGCIKAWNAIYAMTHRHYVMGVGDDVLFRTKGWDRKLISKMPIDDIGLVGCLAIQNGGDNYDHALMTRKWFSIAGCVAPEEMKHYYVDSFHIAIGKRIGRLICNRGVLLEHFHHKRHPQGLKRDGVYQKNEAGAGHDRDVFCSYKGRIKAIAKLMREAMQCGS